MQTTRHAFGEIFRCRACTKHLENFAEYVTTVTTMSSEGAKSACLVVWLAGHKPAKRQRKRRKSKKKVAFDRRKATKRQRKRRKSKKKVAFDRRKVTKRQRKRRKRNYSGSPPTHSHFEHVVFFSRL